LAVAMAGYLSTAPTTAARAINAVPLLVCRPISMHGVNIHNAH
jgi:hypothetical protein